MIHRLATTALPLLAACAPCDTEAVSLAPLERDDWPTSTPEAAGVDVDAVAQLMCEIDRAPTAFAALVAKGGELVAELYANGATPSQLSSRASVTKSYTGALVGLAVDQGCLSLDDRMLDVFPELGPPDDPRKADITIEDMLQMRSGYPWEEKDAALWEQIYTRDYIHLIDDIALTADPGTVHQYSNFTAHWLGIVVARACATDLRTFAEDHLFEPTGTTIGAWDEDADGYATGAWGLEVTARDMARFGQVVLDGGRHGETQVLPEAWVDAMLTPYSAPTAELSPGPFFTDWGYGYQWWSAQAGPHHVDFAWGHGGNFIFLQRDLDLVVVITADPFLEGHFDAWPSEKHLMDLGGAFFHALPAE